MKHQVSGHVGLLFKPESCSCGPTPGQAASPSLDPQVCHPGPSIAKPQSPVQPILAALPPTPPPLPHCQPVRVSLGLGPDSCRVLHGPWVVPSHLQWSSGSMVVSDEKLVKRKGSYTLTNVKLKINYDSHRNAIMQIIIILF